MNLLLTLERAKIVYRLYGRSNKEGHLKNRRENKRWNKVLVPDETRVGWRGTGHRWRFWPETRQRDISASNT